MHVSIVLPCIYNVFKVGCFDKEVTKENLLQPSEPKNSISVPEDNVLLCFEENASDDILMRIVENEQISQICYMHAYM